LADFCASGGGTYLKYAREEVGVDPNMRIHVKITDQLILRISNAPFLSTTIPVLLYINKKTGPWGIDFFVVFASVY
jgi:hypothetical protein